MLQEAALTGSRTAGAIGAGETCIVDPTEPQSLKGALCVYLVPKHEAGSKVREGIEVELQEAEVEGTRGRVWGARVGQGERYLREQKGV